MAMQPYDYATETWVLQTLLVQHLLAAYTTDLPHAGVTVSTPVLPPRPTGACAAAFPLWACFYQ